MTHVHLIFFALFFFRIGSSTLFTSLAPRYRKIIRYTLNGNMEPHVDNHHAIGAVSVVLQPGAEGNALYTCNDQDPLWKGEVSNALIYHIIFSSLNIFCFIFVLCGTGCGSSASSSALRRGSRGCFCYSSQCVSRSGTINLYKI